MDYSSTPTLLIPCPCLTFPTSTHYNTNNLRDRTFNEELQKSYNPRVFMSFGHLCPLDGSARSLNPRYSFPRMHTEERERERKRKKCISSTFQRLVKDFYRTEIRAGFLWSSGVVATFCSRSLLTQSMGLFFFFVPSFFLFFPLFFSFLFRPTSASLFLCVCGTRTIPQQLDPDRLSIAEGRE